MRKGIAVGLSVLVSGCATPAAQVAPSYVSAVAYSGMSCGELVEEARTISSRAATAAGTQDSNRTKDAVATTVGLVVFWPALFFIGGDSYNTAELARLKGEMQAIEAQARRKKCDIAFKPEGS